MSGQIIIELWDDSDWSGLATSNPGSGKPWLHSSGVICIGGYTPPDLSTKADLVAGKVPSSQLPSYVDDVVEYSSSAAFPGTGETGKIYVALDTNRTYRWSGSAYIELTDQTAVWGSISGTLASQTDLQSALDGKQAAGSYAAASHTHTTSQVTGLDAALAAKLDSATAATTYQPLDSDLTAIAALATTTFGRSLLTQADAASARSTLGAQASLGYTAANDSAVVHNTGAEAIAGAKSVSSDWQWAWDVGILLGESNIHLRPVSTSNSSNLVVTGNRVNLQVPTTFGNYGFVVANFGSGNSIFEAHSSGIVFGHRPNSVALYCTSANVAEQRNGSNAQTFRLYNTYTDASNYERGFMRWNSNVFEVGHDLGGTGANRLFKLVSNGMTVATLGLGSTVGSASADGNHSWIQLRGGATFIQTNGQTNILNGIGNVGIGGGNNTYQQLLVTPDAWVASRYTMNAGTSTFRIYIQDQGGQDKAHKNMMLSPEDAGASNTVNISGGNTYVRGGHGASGSAGAANGGSVYVYGGTKYGTGAAGNVILAHDGSAANGRVLVGTATDDAVSQLQVSGNVGLVSTSGNALRIQQDGYDTRQPFIQFYRSTNKLGALYMNEFWDLVLGADSETASDSASQNVCVAVGSGKTFGVARHTTSGSPSFTVSDTGNVNAVAATLTGAFKYGPKTFATLPSASANQGARYRLTDRGEKVVYSDGTDWRFDHDNSIAS